MEEIPKYRKKKKGERSDSSKKTKHKHTYVPCLLHRLSNDSYGYAEYCSICGKLSKDIRLFETKPHETNPSLTVMLTNAEIKEKYKHLEEKDVVDYMQNYI